MIILTLTFAELELITKIPYQNPIEIGNSIEDPCDEFYLITLDHDDKSNT